MESRRFARLLLVLALLFGQQVAFAHAIGHGFEATAAQPQDDQQVVDKVCAECLAQTQLFGPVTAPPSRTWGTGAAPGLVARALPVPRFAPVPAYRSRAPPHS